ncbi:MAG: DUF3667 domain-containing protein [Bacteroidales bacterium]|nr:DUF3667 domain-containing protein [Bacteroidales bacterium]
MKQQNIIESGQLTQRKREVEPGMHHCLNCGKEFEGSFCPNCGQAARVQRITGQSLVKQIISSVLNFEANIPRTLIDLFYRPGYLIADYLTGKRKDYSNPFSTLLLLVAAYLFLNEFVFKDQVRQAMIDYSTQVGMGLNRELNPQADVALGPTPEMQYAQEMELAGAIFDYFSVFNLLLIPVVAFPLWLVFRKVGRFAQQSLNFFEALVAVAYLSCLNMVINLVSAPFLCISTMSTITIVGYVICIPLCLLSLRQLFLIGWGQVLWRSAVFVVLLVVFYIITFIVMGIGYALFAFLTQ